MLTFLKAFDQSESSSRVAIIKLTYLYYKNDATYATIKARLASKGAEDPSVYMLENSEEVISGLVA